VQKGFYLVKEIGIPQLTEYAFYQLAQKSGMLAKKTSSGGPALDFDPDHFELKIPVRGPDSQL